MESRRISGPAQAILDNLDNDLLLSSVTPWALGIKVARKKLVLPPDLPRFVMTTMANLELSELPVTIVHALRSAELPLIHGDPFDRMLVAQALVEGIPIVSSDRRLSQYGVAVIW